MTARKQKRVPRKGFQKEYGFDPVVGQGILRVEQRNLERRIVADHLSELWRTAVKCEQELQLRDPPSWMRKRERLPVPNRFQLSDRLAQLRLKYRRAEKYARAFGLHPDQPSESA